MWFRLLGFIFLGFALTSCSGIGRGIAEAVLQRDNLDDNRQCSIWSDGFDGIEASFEEGKHKVAKVLMVHGVGDHSPGYSTTLMENITKELGMSVKSRYNKNVQLKGVDHAEIYSDNRVDKNLGNLRLTRFKDSTGQRELYFYELTWSAISRPEKSILNYDSAGEYVDRRASLNNSMKVFSNDAISDPMVYLGEKGGLIQASVQQSLCYMLAYEWEDFPEGDQSECDLVNSEYAENLRSSELIFITHSLGSRILIDSMSELATLLNNQKVLDSFDGLEDLSHALREKEMQVFMLSNQLPLLQLGREKTDVSGQIYNYCRTEGDKHNERFVSGVQLVAFSDPNDVLSYAISQDFEKEYIDSRLCATVSNVVLNIAHVKDLMGFGEWANPFDAHTGYDDDERTIELLVHGVAENHVPALIEERCHWTRID